MRVSFNSWSSVNRVGGSTSRILANYETGVSGGQTALLVDHRTIFRSESRPVWRIWFYVTRLLHLFFLQNMSERLVVLRWSYHLGLNFDDLSNWRLFLVGHTHLIWIARPWLLFNRRRTRIMESSVLVWIVRLIQSFRSLSVCIWIVKIWAQTVWVFLRASLRLICFDVLLEIFKCLFILIKISHYISLTLWIHFWRNK